MDGQDPVLVQLYYCWGAEHILYGSLSPPWYKRVLGVKKLLLVVGIFSLRASVCPACCGLLGQLWLPAQRPCIVLPVPLGQKKPAGRWWFCATRVWPEGVRWSGRVSLWSSVVHVAELLLWPSEACVVKSEASKLVPCSFAQGGGVPRGWESSRWRFKAKIIPVCMAILYTLEIFEGTLSLFWTIQKRSHHLPLFQSSLTPGDDPEVS